MAGYNTRRSNDFHGKSIKDEDFDEESAAWDFSLEEEEEEDEASNPISRNFNHCDSLASAPKLIPKEKATANQQLQTMKRFSAPVEIPDWSKIYGRNNGNMSSWMNHDYVNYDDDDDDNGNIMVPPHEWIAMKLARSQISSFSVCEGIGRTLKGRDLSKVRNAILTKTGFLE